MNIEDILEKTKEDLKKKKEDYPFQWLGRSLSLNPFMPKNIFDFLNIKSHNIAKIKNYEDYDLIQKAINSELLNDCALWINTEPIFFKGKIENLGQIRRYVNLPLIRYDFIIDEYQILESLVYGADCIVLMPKLFNQKELNNLSKYTNHLGLDAIFEISSIKDLKKSILAGAKIIRIKMENKLEIEKIILAIPKNKIIIIEKDFSNFDWFYEIKKNKTLLYLKEE